MLTEISPSGKILIRVLMNKSSGGKIGDKLSSDMKNLLRGIRELKRLMNNTTLIYEP